MNIKILVYPRHVQMVALAFRRAEATFALAYLAMWAPIANSHQHFHVIFYFKIFRDQFFSLSLL